MAFNGQFLNRVISQANGGGSKKKTLIGIDKAPEELIKDGATVEFTRLNQNFEAALKQSKDPFLGIRISQSMNLSAAELIFQIAQSSTSFKEAMLRACEYAELGCPALPVRLEEDDFSYSIIYEYDRIWRTHSEITFRHTLEGAIFFLLKQYEALSNRKFAPMKVTLDYIPEAGFKNLEKHFNSPVFVRDLRNSVVFRKKDFDTKVFPAEDNLLKLLIEYANHRITKINDHIRDSAKVARIILNHLPDRATVEQVSAQLNVSPRTLQRRLKDEGTSFREILEDQSLSFAKTQLGRRKYSLSEIAHTLNYSDLSAFSRAYKKHYGVAPSLN